MIKQTCFPAIDSAELNQASLPTWLLHQKSESAARLSGMAVPNRKTESWKYSSRYIDLDSAMAPTGTAGSEEIPFTDLGGDLLVFDNGELRRDLSRLPQSGYTINLLDQLDEAPALINALVDDNVLPFAPLNSSRMTTGIQVVVDKNATPAKTLQIVYFNRQGSSTAPRILVELGENAAFKIVEEYLSEEGVAFTNAISEVHLAGGARLDLVRLSLEQEAVSHVGATLVSCLRDSQFYAHSIGFGGKLRRHDLQVQLRESGAFCALNGVTITQRSQHYDNHTNIEHIAPNCNSEETYRTIAADKSHSIFNGRIHIHRDAQKSNAAMSNKNLLLSSQAEIDTKPELEIYADDVKCAHGATVGQLDPKALFYLVSRGIDKATAATMLSLGFVNELIDQLPVEGTADIVNGRLEAFIQNTFTEQDQ